MRSPLPTRRFRGPLLALCGLLLSASTGSAQDVNRVRASLLRDVMPEADRFEEASGNPPVRRAFKGDELLGYVFVNTDIPPEVFGYSGPIETVIGMKPDGTLTGMRVVDYHETYMRTRGDFLRSGDFQQQFAGKSVGDPFRIGEDVDGISRVSISVRATVRGIRQASRSVATTYMRMPEQPAAPIEDLTSLSWFDMRAMGIAPRFEIQEEGRDTPLGVSLLHLETEALARYLFGDLYNYALRAVEDRPEIDEMVLYVVDGTRPQLETREGWSIEQDGTTTVIPPEDVEMLGGPWEGVLQGETSLVGVILLDDEKVDIARPMTFVFDRGPDLGTYRVDFVSQRAKAMVAEAETPAVAAATVASAEGAGSTAPASDAVSQPATATDDAAAAVPELDATSSTAPTPSVSSEASPALAQLDLLDFEEEPEPSLVERLLLDVSWARMGWVALVLVLATLAFFTKRKAIRWVSLATTFAVLGYVDGGFLSVSHITSAIWVGPSVFLNDLPLLLMVTFTVLAIVFWGRIFCGYLCPFGALQDFIDAVVPKRFQRELPKGVHRGALKAKYGILAIIVLPALAGSETSLYQYFEPFGTVFSIGPSKLLWTIAGTILIGSAIVPRFYCRYMCPLGAALALGSVFSLNRIRRVEQCKLCKVCERKCPTGAIEGPSVDFKECVRCNVCEIELLEKTGVCRHDMETIRPRLVQLKAKSPPGLSDLVVRSPAP